MSNVVPVCVASGCARPAQTQLCAGCWGELERELAESRWLAEQLEITVSRQDKIRGASVGLVHGNSETPLPYCHKASAAADRLRVELGRVVRHLHETHPIRWLRCAECAADYYSGDRVHERPGCTGGWEQRTMNLDVEDAIAELAAWLLRHPSWVQHDAAAEETHAQLMAAFRAARAAVFGPRARDYLGPCESIDDETGAICRESLYVTDGQTTARCRTCGVEVDVAQRRAAMTERLRGHLLGATELSRALMATSGTKISPSTIKNWANRGLISRRGHPAGHGLYVVGEVLDYALARGKLKVA